MPSPRNGGVPAQPTRGATPPPRDTSVAVQRAFLSGSRALMHPGGLACRFQPAAPERTSTEAGPGALAVFDTPSLGASFRLLLSIIACASCTLVYQFNPFSRVRRTCQVCGAAPGGLRGIAFFRCRNGLFPGTFHRKPRTSSPGWSTSPGTGRRTPSPGWAVQLLILCILPYAPPAIPSHLRATRRPLLPAATG